MQEVQFDPGFVRHMSAFVPNIEYVYGSLAQFRNFSQKKQQFKMYYPKIQSLLKSYMGFYLGCMLWALYIKQFDGAKIFNNLCFGVEYNEVETLNEVDFIKKYIEQLKKDAKYYANQEFIPDESFEKILDTYREFLKLNEGFVKTQTTTDIKIPASIKTPKDLDAINIEIRKVCENGKIYELLPLAGQIL